MLIKGAEAVEKIKNGLPLRGKSGGSVKIPMFNKNFGIPCESRAAR
jgi:hypothetical protein